MPHSSEISTEIKKREIELAECGREMRIANSNVPKPKLFAKQKWLKVKLDDLQVEYRKQLQREGQERKEYEQARNDVFVTAIQELSSSMAKMLTALGSIHSELQSIKRHLEFLKSGTVTQ